MSEVVERLGSFRYRIGPARPTRQSDRTKTERQSGAGSNSFAEVLNRELARRTGQIRFSAHAEKRLQSRNIDLDRAQLDALCAAVDKAAGKGCRESLILMGDLAFVVSIKNRTVITVVDGDRMQDNVFTNIDSAVVTNGESGPDLT